MAAGAGGVLPSGTIFGGDFRVVRLLGAGGMGEVYVVEQLSTGRARALKIMNAHLAPSEEQRGRFQLEARVGSMIASDHVVEVIAAGFDEQTGAPYLVMELLEGETLEERLARAGPLPAAELAGVFDQLGHALGAAHANGIVHRDLKPANVFLSRPRLKSADAVVKVLDFGVAKLVGGTNATHTRQVGTPTYMAPEQCRAEAITTATDVWALGLIAFRLLTGEAYWLSAHRAEATPLAVMFEIGYEPLVAASERAAALGFAGALPRGFDAWFARCVARSPSERFADAGLASSALVALLEGRAPSSADALPPTNAITGRLPEPIAPTTVEEPSGRLHDAHEVLDAHAAPTTSPRAPSLVERGAPEHTLRSAVAPTQRAQSAQSAPSASSRGAARVVAIVAALALLASAAVAGALRLRAAHATPLRLAALPPTSCPDDMAFLPAGTFRRAASGRATVAAYCMDRLEVSIAAYDACVSAGACTPSKGTVAVRGYKDVEIGWRSLFCPRGRLAGGGAHPVTCVDTRMAQAYCAWKKRRLPTDVEFEWAARGGARGTKYPWGVHLPEPAHACLSTGGVLRGWSASLGPWEAWSRTPEATMAGSCEVGSHPKGASPAGVQDLIGNAWELVVASQDGETVYETAGAGWNTGNAAYIHAGGFWTSGWTAEDLDADTGFRCVGAPE